VVQLLVFFVVVSVLVVHENNMMYLRINGVLNLGKYSSFAEL
jgi:hypothetical protein